MNMRIFIFITGILVMAAGIAGAKEAGNHIVASNAWVAVPPPLQTTAAAYVTFTNNSSNEVILSSASSDAASAVEIHQMSDMKGMMNMSMVSSLRIPAKGEITFKPGGLHIMLIGLKQQLHPGDVVSLKFNFTDGQSVVTNAQVKPLS